MSDYQPTDEQVEELGRYHASMTEEEWTGGYYSHLVEDAMRSAKRLIASPAFQSIIRAAQSGGAA